MIGKKVFGVAGMFLLFGCGTVERSELNSHNPNEAIVELNSIKENALKDQVDLLARYNFSKGEKTLTNAVQVYRKDGDREEVLLDLAESKALFLKARAVAQRRGHVPSRILEARKASLENGVREDYKQINDLRKLDKNLIYKTSKFSKSLDADDLSELEKNYLKLEVKSVQNRELRTFRKIVRNAEDYDGDELAPVTYKNAVTLLSAAENMIQQSSRNPESFRESVNASKTSAKLLNDVMDKLKGVASGASETAALEMVVQERKLGTLSDRAGTLQGKLVQSQSNLNETKSELQYTTKQALLSSGKILNQQAIDDMRNFFTKEEADVYQQGGSLIIRLKKLDFEVGSSDISNGSTRLLSKVNSAIVNLKSSNIVVEGHTDSTGGESLNKGLSVARSEAVANHLKSLGTNRYEIVSEGFGASRPIANNRSKEGRAMNRRVDVVIKTN